jgi:hypothetical protein
MVTHLETIYQEKDHLGLPGSLNDLFTILQVTALQSAGFFKLSDKTIHALLLKYSSGDIRFKRALGI